MNSARSGDHNQRYCCVRFIHHLYGYPDSIRIRLWRGADRRSVVGALHSTKRRSAACRPCIDHGRWHRRSAGLGKDPPRQCGLARVLYPLRYPFGSPAFDEQPSKISEGYSCRDYHGFLCLFLNRPHAAGTATRQSTVAHHLWILCRRAGRGLRNEWSAAGCLRSHAKVVRTKLPRNPSRIFFTRQHHWHGWLLVGRTLDLRSDALLSALITGHTAGCIPWQSDQSSPPRRGIFEIPLHRIDGHRSAVTGAGNKQPIVTLSSANKTARATPGRSYTSLSLTMVQLIHKMKRPENYHLVQ
jgi:hypothetical protein